MKPKMINRLKKWRATRPLVVCPNCGQKTYEGHFVPPGFGEPGAFICEAKGAK
jgi:hypothetical protein